MKKILITVAALALISNAAIAQKQTPPAGGTPKGFTLPAKNTRALPNGMKATLVQFGAVPKVNISLIIKTGNVHEAANQVWLADLTGNLLKEGSTTMNLKTIAKKVAAMGGEINVNTAMDQVTITGSVLSEFAGDLIAIMSDVVMNPAFPASEIDRLKSDLKRQLAVQKQQPSQQASEKFFQIIYPDHAYGRYFPTEEMLNSYTVEMVKEFYSKNFGAKRSVIYVAGKFDEAKVSAAIDKAFTNWAAGPEVSYPPATQKKTNEVAQIDRKGAPQTTVIVGLPTLTPKDQDFVALQVTNTLLGGAFGSRITRNIREDKGYTYSPFSTIQNRKGVSVWYEQADVTTEHTGASLTEIAKEINKLQKEVPSTEEAEGIKKYMAGTFVLQNSSSGGIINQLNFLDLHGLDDAYLTDRVKNIYAVTPEKMSQMAKDYLKYEDMTLVLVGDKKEIEKQKKALEDARKLR